MTAHRVMMKISGMQQDDDDDDDDASDPAGNKADIVHLPVPQINGRHDATQREANAARHPLKRVGEATDIAHMAAFLLSDNASWISGQVLHVDGGISSLRV